MSDQLEAMGIAFPGKNKARGTALSRQKSVQALQNAIDSTSLTIDEIIEQPQVRQRVISRSCEQLIKQKDFAEALVFADAREPETERLKLRSRLLILLGETKQLNRALDELEAKEKKTLEGRILVLRQRLKEPTLLRPRDHNIFGTPQDRIQDQIRQISPEIGKRPSVDRIANKLIKLRGITGDDANVFRDLVRWGWSMQLYLRFLARYANGARQKNPDYKGAPLEQHLRILELSKQAETVLPVIGENTLEAERDAGRSILLVQSHSGHSGFMSDYLDTFKMKRIAFAVRALELDESNPLNLTFGATGDTHSDFLKAVRMVRNSPHLIRITPDGPFGDRRTQGSILGVPSSIGDGAAVLGWHAKAITYFGETRWRDDGRIDLIMTAGPDAMNFDSRQAFEEAFNAFYFERLNDIAKGAPQDMTCVGGMWNSFMNA